MKTILYAALAILAGCAASTPQAARDMGPDRQYAFQVDADYQVVYRRLVEIERSCYQTTLITASQLVNADLYPDTRSGTISVGMYGIATSIYQVIDIQGENDGKTQVRATFPMGNPQKYGELIKAWADGTRKGC